MLCTTQPRIRLLSWNRSDSKTTEGNEAHPTVCYEMRDLLKQVSPTVFDIEVAFLLRHLSAIPNPDRLIAEAVEFLREATYDSAQYIWEQFLWLSREPTKMLSSHRSARRNIPRWFQGPKHITDLTLPLPRLS